MPARGGVGREKRSRARGEPASVQRDCTAALPAAGWGWGWDSAAGRDAAPTLARVAPPNFFGARGEEMPAPSEGGFILLGLTAGDCVCGRDGRMSAARPLSMITASKHVSAIAALPSFCSASGNQA